MLSSIPPRVWPSSSSIFDQETGLRKQAQPLYAISLSHKQRHYLQSIVHCQITVPCCPGKGAGLRPGRAFPYCALQLSYSQPHHLNPAMDVVSPPHPSSGSCRDGSTRKLPKVTPSFPQPQGNAAWRLSPPSFLSLPPEYSLKPSLRLISQQRRALLGVLLTTLSFLPPGPEASIHYVKQQG